MAQSRSPSVHPGWQMWARVLAVDAVAFVFAVIDGATPASLVAFYSATFLVVGAVYAGFEFRGIPKHLPPTRFPGLPPSDMGAFVGFLTFMISAAGFWAAIQATAGPTHGSLLALGTLAKEAGLASWLAIVGLGSWEWVDQFRHRRVDADAYWRHDWNRMREFVISIFFMILVGLPAGIYGAFARGSAAPAAAWSIMGVAAIMACRSLALAYVTYHMPQAKGDATSRGPAPRASAASSRPPNPPAPARNPLAAPALQPQRPAQPRTPVPSARATPIARTEPPSARSNPPEVGGPATTPQRAAPASQPQVGNPPGPPRGALPQGSSRPGLRR